MFEKELFMISRLAQLRADKSTESFLYKYEYVFECMKKNSVQANSNIKARMFEYALLND
jgi:hypothetical protein